VFEAFETVPVPIAVLAYFVYPLLTGLAGTLSGLDRLGWRGALTALAAFAGLALMIGAHPGALSPVGLSWAFFAAACRTAMLLVQRAALPEADSRLTSGWSLLSSTTVLVLLCLATQSWQVPSTGIGWAGFLGMSLFTTGAIVALYASTARIGPFRTALLMNLEPLTSVLLSALLLGESIAGVQWLGAAVMISSLIAFQFRNRP
jgi:drug/metabolite transporter (DMT)-like permease